ncbi:MAG: hypothetical protein FJX61_16865 [Alphaproteobacteria bacterium]|nr:hypothetical protein [Alphaproteobacteria bacterium]
MERVTFQVYSFEGDRWMLDEQYPKEKQSMAIEAAKRLTSQPGVKAVKVVRETYDDDSGRYKEFTVFDSQRVGRRPASPSDQ